MGIILILLILIFSLVFIKKRLEETFRYNEQIEYIEEKYKNIVKIEFDKFKNFYNISPEKYELKDLKDNFYVVYFSDLECKENTLWPYLKEKLPIYLLVFSYRDYKRAIKFYNQIENEKEKNRKERYIVNYLNSVQNDINEIKKQAKSYVDESLKIVNEVKNRSK